MRRTLSVLIVTGTLLGCALATAPATAQWTNLGFGTTGSTGVPRLQGTKARFGRVMHLHLRNARPNAPLWFGIGLNRINQRVFGGVLVPNPQLIFPARSDAQGYAHLAIDIPNLCGFRLAVVAQALVVDPQGPSGYAFSTAGSNRLKGDIPSDFNGDGLTDLAIGVPGKDLIGKADVGRVRVVYGRKTGLPLLAQTIRQGLSITGGTIGGVAEAGDQFGAAIAVGDFNGDGYDDLTVGVPRESIESVNATEAGVVHAIYGGSQGLQASNDQVFWQGRNGMPDQPEAYDWFGKSLAAGDFNGDGYDDLAIGAPFENETLVNEGVVQILFGGPNGLTTVGGPRIRYTQATPDGRHGWSLAAGDFNRDGYADLACGRPYQDVSGQQDAGAVTVYHNLRQNSNLIAFHQDSNLRSVAIRGVAEKFDLFGFSLTAGDFDGDGTDDLAIGVPFEDIGSTQAAGAINVVYGIRNVGLSGAGNQVWHQDSTGISGVAELGDNFGYALTSGDFDNNGVCDLAIGVPDERIGTVRGGAAHVIYGRRGVPLAATGSQLWHQATTGIVNAPGANDRFGWSLFAGDVNGDCKFDLVIGVPGETIGTNARAGAAHVIYGSTTGLRATNNEIWREISAATDDRLGASLAESQDQRPL